MAEGKASFDSAVKMVDSFAKTPSNDELLSLYGFFKQANIGDNETAKPGMLNVRGKKKWEAWMANKGMSKEEARAKYVEFAESIKAKYQTK